MPRSLWDSVFTFRKGSMEPNGKRADRAYWLNDNPFTLGRWVVVSAKSPEAIWASKRGFVGQNWPLLKRVAGVPGDEICR